MLLWIGANIGTILISAALLAVVVGIIVRMRKDRQKGKSSCGGNCGHCPMCTSCHQE